MMGNDESRAPAIPGDGRFVALQSRATNPVTLTNGTILSGDNGAPGTATDNSFQNNPMLS